MRKPTFCFVVWILLATILPTTTHALCLIPPGDVTAEGTTSVLDVQCQILAVLATIAEQPTPPCLSGGFATGDHNCDGGVNTTDVVLVITFALGGALAPELDADSDLCVDVCYCLANPGLTCNDQDPCTNFDRCTDGVCVGLPIICNDQNPCTADICTPTTGQCGYPPIPGPCEDGNPCTTSDFCNNGQCLHGPALNCNDNNPCTKDTCGPDGTCIHVPAPGPCSDSDPCTVVDYCDAGICIPGTPIECGDGNPCTTDTCSVTSEGQCVYTHNTAPCSDGNPCTTSDVCATGLCQPGTIPLVCNDSNGCTNDTCNPQVGCVFTPTIAKPCTDNSLCTTNDMCGTNGACVGQPKVCDDGNLCTTNGCNPSTGTCTFTNNTLLCDDGDDCTLKDGCGKGACLPGIPKVCNDNNVCTNDTCGKGGVCLYTPTGVKPCSDGNSCTFQDQCANGQCFGIPSTTVCDDGKPCTLDACLETGGCLHAYAPVGACKDEGCYDVGCNPSTFECEIQGFLDAFAPCDDGDPCTPSSHCQPTFLNLSCEATSTKNCNDGNPCTADSCNAALDGVCQSTLEPNGTPCLNANTCLGQCATGSCVSVLNCNDNNTCTADYCEPDPCKGDEFQGSCYEVFDGTIYVGKTWGQAEEACQTWGGHLASITSAAENDFVADLLKDGPYVIEFRPFLHIGGLNYLPPSGKFQWSNGDPFVYTKWAESLPGNAFEPGRTTAIWMGTGIPEDEEHWTTVSGAKGPYVCERPIQGLCHNNPQCPAEKPGCNTVHGAGGCNDTGCEWCVCREGAGCCLASWEASCITLATSECANYCD